MPIIWHIMKIYSSYGINDFVICCGYKGNMIKEYFSNNNESWNVICADTGLETMTGGRLKRIAQFVDKDSFCFTYGDGLSDVNMTELIDFHKNKGTVATVTAVQPPGRFGTLKIDDDKISSFTEKPAGDGNWINGGFFVLESKIFDYIENDSTIWELDPLEKLSSQGQLSAFKHRGFWQPLDTLRDKNHLDDLWNSHKAPWKIW